MTKKADSDDIAELAEPFIDEASRQLLQRFAGEALPDLIGDIPIAKSFLAIGKIFNGAKDYHRAKMTIAFLNSLSSGDKSIEEYEKLEPDSKNYIRSLVVSQLDMQSDERQAEAIGLIVDAYLHEKVDRLTFTGILSEIKNTNPLLYYFNVDAIDIKENDNGVTEAKGPTYLLPAAFGHNTISDIGQWGSTGSYKFVLTLLGKAFFKHVYNPMAEKEMV